MRSMILTTAAIASHCRCSSSTLASLHGSPAHRKSLSPTVYIRWTPNPVIVTMRNSQDYIRALLYSEYTTITGWGVLLIFTRRVWQRVAHQIST